MWSWRKDNQCVFLGNKQELLLILLTDGDLEGRIDQINSYTPSSMCFIILSSKETSFDMVVVMGATTWHDYGVQHHLSLSI